MQILHNKCQMDEMVNTMIIFRSKIFSRVMVVMIIGIITPLFAGAQQQLTLHNAIDTALLKNYDIRLSKNDLEISQVNNSYGMAGGLPLISGNASDTYSDLNTLQKSHENIETNITKQGENSINAGVSASLLLFNGFRINAAKERLEKLENLGEIELNQQIQSTLSDIILTYYDIIRQQDYYKIILQSLDVADQKLKIVSLRGKVGMADAVELLQAQTDARSAEQSLAMQDLVVKQTKSDLLLLMGSKMSYDYIVTDSILVDQSLELEAIMNSIDRNPQLQGAEQQILINKQLLKEVNAQRYPSLKVSAGYDFFRSDWSKGNMLMNRVYGPSAGISLQVPVFNGFIYKTQKEVAKLRLENTIIQREKLLNDLAIGANQLYRNYSTTISQIDSQRQNYEMTRKLVEVVLQKFHHRQATILDVKAAQASFENAAYMLTNLKYSAKVAETGLKQLTFSLTY